MVFNGKHMFKLMKVSEWTAIENIIKKIAGVQI